MASEKSVSALRLVLGGAPANWHTLSAVATEDGAEVGLAGHYHPDKPTPLGYPGLPSLDDAKRYIAEHKKMVDRARKGWAAYRQERLDGALSDIGEFVEPPCPVELVKVSEAEAEKTRAELAELHGAALKAAYLAEQAGDGQLPHVESQAAAVAGPS